MTERSGSRARRRARRVPTHGAIALLVALFLFLAAGCGGTNWYARGMELFKEESYEEAIKAFDKAIKNNPSYPEAWFAKGDCYHWLERHEEAVASFEYAYWNIVKNHKEAIESCQKALDANPDDYALLRLRGDFYRENGKQDEAIACYDRAILINPKDFQAWAGKYRSLKTVGRETEAEQFRLQGQQAGVF